MVMAMHPGRFSYCFWSPLLVAAALGTPMGLAAPAEDPPVGFARHLAQVLDQRCANCHANERPRARLNLASFRGLMRGGDSGEVVVPGKPEESLLIQKLKGTAEGQRMPQGGPPLADEVIEQWEAWVRQGAAFDASDPDLDVRQLAAIARAQRATHDQLRDERAALAGENWRLVLPEQEPARLQTRHFLLLGNVGADELQKLASVAEELVPRIAKVFRAPRDTPLVKGAITLFAFESSYDYGELGRMVEKRDVDPAARAHFRYSVIDAYVALHAGLDDPQTCEAVLAQQIAGLYVASLGQSPKWFRQGAARATAARLAPRATLVQQRNEKALQAFVRLQEPDDFLKGRSTAADADSLAFSYVQFLMGDTRRFHRFIGLLREGTGFAASFAQSYGAAPEQVAALWARRTMVDLQRRGRRGR